MGADSLRDKLNNNSSIVTIITVALLIGAIALMVKRKVGPSRPPAPAWFYDTVSGERFIDDATKRPPIISPAGNEAVRVRIYSCGECNEDEMFAGYYEKYNEETKKIIEENPEVLMFARQGIKGRFYSADGKTWAEDGSTEAEKVQRTSRDRCKNGVIRTCLPEKAN